MDMYNPLEDPREELDPITGQPVMPNTPRNPDDPREKLKSYLAAKMDSEKKMMDPAYRETLRAPANSLMENSRALAFQKLLQDSAAQMGAVGGKIASNAGADAYTQQLQGLNQQAMQGIEKERAEVEGMEDRRGKMLQYLSDKYETGQAREASLGIQKQRLEADAADRKRQQSNADRQYELEKQKIEIERGKNLPGAKDKAATSEEITKQMVKLSPIRNEIASALKVLKDPNVSDDDKIRIGQGLVKTLNSTQGADAIGAEEAARLASELETSIGVLGKGLTYGAGAGATTGAALAGIPTLGIGAPVGAGIGAAGGGLLGLGSAALNEMSKPGGIKFSPDIAGFTSRVEGSLGKIDSLIGRQQRLQELVKEGRSIPEANAIIDRELAEKDW